MTSQLVDSGPRISGLAGRQTVAEESMIDLPSPALRARNQHVTNDPVTSKKKKNSFLIKILISRLVIRYISFVHFQGSFFPS